MTDPGLTIATGVIYIGRNDSILKKKLLDLYWCTLAQRVSAEAENIKTDMKTNTK